MDPKVSIVITAHNYGHYLSRCLDSALSQTYDDYEVVVVDDGSTDDTPEILQDAKFEHPDRLRTIRLEGEGLPSASNRGIEAARGEYVIRLDADDYFDENILAVEAEHLDSNPDIDLVYPDYYTIDDDENVLDHVRLRKVNDEVKLLNRSPLAAGAMYRKSAWETIGGYDESLDYQEDYDFWIRFINEFDVYNVNLPLMYYRQHDTNMSQNLSGRLDARRDVKRTFVETNLGEHVDDNEVLAVIPAMAEARVDSPDGHVEDLDPLALHEVEGRPLIGYTIREALAAKNVDRTVVSTENEQIADVARGLGADVPRLRPPELAEHTTELSEVVVDLLDSLAESEGYEPDLVVLLQYISPLKTSEHVDEVVDTYRMFSVDSVISVTENRKFLWQPGKYGLQPLFDKRLLREERETLYEENGAIYAFSPRLVADKGQLIGDNVGHTLMQRQTAVHVDSWFDLKTVETLLADGNGLAPEYRSAALQTDR